MELFLDTLSFLWLSCNYRLLVVSLSGLVVSYAILSLSLLAALPAGSHIASI